MTSVQTAGLSRAKERKAEKKRALQLRRAEEDLKEVSDALQTSESCFNEITDSDLTDAVIFERAALQARYSYLLREIRELSESAALF